jgi:phosphinothricin acetyltransferase
MPLRIRLGEAHDLSRLVDIYNHYVADTHITFDTEPFAVGTRTHWFTQFADTGPYRLYVAETDDGVIGYACSQPFKVKPGYNTSVETSVYLDPEHTGRAVGSRLYEHLLDEITAEESLHRAYGGIALPNSASIRLHEKLGFVHVASYHEVGFKFGKYWDVNWYEKDLS